MPNRVIEIHDSALDRISVEDGSVALYFPHVYIHQSEGRPGWDAGTGWSQAAVLRIGNAQVEGSFAPEGREGYAGGDDVYWLHKGSLTINGLVSDNLIPIPLDVQGDIELKLGCGGDVIRVAGNSVTLTLIGEAEYLEDFRPARNTVL